MIFARSALLPDGWHRDVWVGVAGGRVAELVSLSVVATVFSTFLSFWISLEVSQVIKFRCVIFVCMKPCPLLVLRIA